VIVEGERAGDPALLEQELAEAHKTIRALLRQLDKERGRYDECLRAYNKTVANLTEIVRANMLLERELDEWRRKGERAGVPVQIGGLGISLTADEVSAIRKAMARLHHPDTGGDAERMKLWNAALDPLE
jgi:diadenosine tetraphosphatase ApaH/serine/threonine PP2A family protein phosphatase